MVWPISSWKHGLGWFVIGNSSKIHKTNCQLRFHCYVSIINSKFTDSLIKILSWLFFYEPSSNINFCHLQILTSELFVVNSRSRLSRRGSDLWIEDKEGLDSHLCACRRQNQNLTSPWSRAHPKWVKPTGDVPWAGWRAIPACAMQEPIPDWRRNHKSISTSCLTIFIYIIWYSFENSLNHNRSLNSRGGSRNFWWEGITRDFQPFWLIINKLCVNL